MLYNKKSQNIISMADRIYNTYEAVVLKKYKDPDTLISFDSTKIDPVMLRKLKAEACRTPMKLGYSTVRFYTKQEMRKGVRMPGGNIVVIPSPNLFDALVLSFDKSATIVPRLAVTPPRPMRTMGIRNARTR